MNHWPPTCARQQRREKTCRSHLPTGGPGQDQGTHKLPATKILERTKRNGRLQPRGPTNFPASSSLESISAEWCVCPQEGCQFRMTDKRQARKEPNDHKPWDCELPSVSLWQSSSLHFPHPPAPRRAPALASGCTLPLVNSQVRPLPRGTGRGAPAPDGLPVPPIRTPTPRTGPQASLLPPDQTPETLADPPHRDNPSYLSTHLSII